MAENKNKKENNKQKGAKMKGGKGEIKSDVNGSYTGVPTDGDKRPVQDADDL